MIKHDEIRKQAVETVREILKDKHKYQCKFVVTNKHDMKEVKEFIVKIPGLNPENVYLMPEGVTKEQLYVKGKWVIEECIKNNFNYCPRLHVEVWGTLRSV